MNQPETKQIFNEKKSKRETEIIHEKKEEE